MGSARGLDRQGARNEGGATTAAPARYETPDVSIGEIAFGKWFRRTYARALMPDDDWLDPSTNTLFELKTVSYPKSHFDSTGRYVLEGEP